MPLGVLVGWEDPLAVLDLVELPRVLTLHQLESVRTILLLRGPERLLEALPIESYLCIFEAIPGISLILLVEQNPQHQH